MCKVEVLPLFLCANPPAGRVNPLGPPATHHAVPEIQGEGAGILECLLPLKENQIRTTVCP